MRHVICTKRANVMSLKNIKIYYLPPEVWIKDNGWKKKKRFDVCNSKVKPRTA